MTAQYIQRAIDRLEGWRGFVREAVVPCSEQEIAALEARLPGGRLPAAYRELLAYGGKQLNDAYRTVDLSFSTVWTAVSTDYRGIVRMLRRRDKAAELPPEVFVISEHLGSNFTFIRLDEGADPPVYFWEEDEGGLEAATREHDTFSAFLLAVIEQYIAYREAALARQQ